MQFLSYAQVRQISQRGRYVYPSTLQKVSEFVESDAEMTLELYNLLINDVSEIRWNKCAV